MIKGLAHAARVFGQPSWALLAQQAVDFIRHEMWVDGRLLATYKDGQARLNAYLDDYAFLLDALQRLGHIFGEAREHDAAERVLTSYYPSIAGQAAGYTILLMALKENQSPPDIVVRGPAAELDVWRTAAAAQYWPNTLAFFVPNGTLTLPPALAKPETPTVNA